MSAGCAQILVWTLLSLAVLLFSWALFFDSLRRRLGHVPPRRCPKCRYDMSCTPGLTCSECGREAKREKELHKSRRRKGWATVAVIIALSAYGLRVYPDVSRHGWTAAVPTTAIIFALPVLHEDFIDVRQEFGLPPAPNTPWMRFSTTLYVDLLRRLKENALTDRQWTEVIERSRSGDRYRQPTTLRWRFTYGNMLEMAIDANRLELADANAFARKYVRVDLLRRSAWPNDRPVSATLIVDGWVPDRSMSNIQFAMVDPYEQSSGQTDSIVGFQFRKVPPAESPFPKRTGVAIVQWDSINPGASSPHLTVQTCWNPLFAFGVSVPDEIRETVELPLEPMPRLGFKDVLRPVHDDELRNAIRNGLVIQVSFGAPWQVWVMIDARPMHNFFVSKERPVIPADVELLRNGQVFQSDSICLWAPPTEDLCGIENRRLPIRLHDEFAFRIGSVGIYDPDTGRYQFRDGEYALRLRANPEYALEFYCCDTYWDGEVTIPLEIPPELQANPSSEN